MKLTAIMPVRNEEWILGFSARVALLWCDQIIILNHCSTDLSRKIAEEICVENPGKVLITDADKPEWREMEHRQRLLTIARQYDATHLALVDADEVITADSLPKVRERAERLAPGECLNVNMYCMWRGLHQYRSDPESVWSNRKDLALVVADDKRIYWQPRDGDNYQHHSRAPRLSRANRNAGGIGVMHLQFADWKRLTAKHALYKVRERIDYPTKAVSEIDRMYNLALDERGIECTLSQTAWFHGYRELTKYVKFSHVSGVEPWQGVEARRLYTEHGPALFRGLNLFGVVG